MTELREVMIAGPPGIRYEASWGRRPPRKSTSWWAGVVHERADGGGMELWHCEHRHATEREALDCAVNWAKTKAAGELAACQPPDLSGLRSSIEQQFGMPFVWGDPWEEGSR